MTDCLSVSAVGHHGMELSGSTLSQNVPKLTDMFGQKASSSSSSDANDFDSITQVTGTLAAQSNGRADVYLSTRDEDTFELHETLKNRDNDLMFDMEQRNDEYVTDFGDDLLGGSLEGEPEDSQEEGVCGVCQQPYTQPPRVLNCLHVFCEACLGKQQRPLSSSPSHGRNTKAVICCPKCNTDTECAQGLKSLPLDYVLINRLDSDAIRKRSVICTSCKSEDLARARCQDCSTFLCSSCQKAHSSMLCFENHLVVSFEAFDLDQAQIHRAVSCLRHPREVAQLYDPTCGTALCNECLVSGHQGHGCKKVNEFDASERADLQILINDAKLNTNKFDDINDTLTSSLSELQLTRDSVRSSIEETFITYKSFLEKAKEAALEELERVHTAQEMRVMDDIQLCQESQVNLEHSIIFGDKLAKYGDAAEFLALKMLVSTRIRKLLHSLPKNQAPKDLKFVSDEHKFKQAVDELFGRIVPAEDVDQHLKPIMNNDSLVVEPNVANMSLLNSSVAPEISNTSAARLLPSELVDAVNSTPIGVPYSHPLNCQTILSSDAQLVSGPALDSIGPAESHLNDLRSALALAHFAGLEPSDVVEPDVLPILVGGVPDVPASSSRKYVGSNSATDHEDHLFNNLSALAKLANPFQAPASLHQRVHCPPLSPTSLAQAGLIDNGLPPSLPGTSTGSVGSTGSSGGQRSPTGGPSSVVSMGTVSPSSLQQSSLSRTKMSPMHIRIKFGQLGACQTQFSSPHGFCLGPNEEIVVADTNNHRIQVFDKAGEFKHEFGAQGKDEGQLWYPRKVAVMKTSGTFVICDRGNERSRMQLFSKNGEFIKKIAIRYIDIVAGLALTNDGRIVAVDSVSPTVFVIAENGELLLWFDCSEHMREPSDIAVWGQEFYICDFKGHCVTVYSECGTYLRRIGGEGLTNFPNGIDISDHGDVLVGDSHGNRFHIVVFNRDGQPISEFECPYCKVSRCCGLKITSEGYVVTLAKNNHHVLILNTLYIN